MGSGPEGSGQVCWGAGVSGAHRGPAGGSSVIPVTTAPMIAPVTITVSMALSPVSTTRLSPRKPGRPGRVLTQPETASRRTMSARRVMHLGRCSPCASPGTKQFRGIARRRPRRPRHARQVIRRSGCAERLRLLLHPKVAGLHVEMQPELRPLRVLEVDLVLEHGAGFLDEELEVVPVPFLERLQCCQPFGIARQVHETAL